MKKIVFVILLLIIKIAAVEKVSVGLIESAEATYNVGEQQELSIKQAIKLAYPAALEWDKNAQLLDAVNIDLEDKAEKSIGSNGKRKYWNIMFGVPDTHKNFLVIIYKGEIERKIDLTVDGTSPYPKKDFIALEDIKYDSPELLKKALKMGNVYPDKDWAKGYNFMLIKNPETNITMMLVVGWNSDGTEMQATGFNASTGEVIKPDF
ncbi:hypothetical protein SAMN05518871_101611 [Psychrobacillus sp. OK028]|uniref:hypothetical protein n=1 Tax=Psychrobacillus sp. OK028 TaxID=1884359 RepID=UPI00088397B3|nr:hypothetical protein [Psychrobacillus sp. OK028]SDM58937.1 hypothetical protein SAMN05518871_101611 [Psychrobacillus sp. OK028]